MTTQAVLLPNGEQQFFNSNGEFLAGGLVYMYIPQTSTPKTTWLDQAQSTPNTNPIILDSLGRAIIWGAGTYRQVVTDSLGNPVWDQTTSDNGFSSIQAEVDTINSEITTINAEITTLQTAIAGPPFWFVRSLTPLSNPYISAVTDSGTIIFSSLTPGSTLTVQLPDVTTLTTGWFIGFVNNTSDILIEVKGSAGEKIQVPSVGSVTTTATATSEFENCILTFDGANFEVISASAATWIAMGAVAGPTLSGTGVSSGTFTIPAASLKITAVGGGAGGTAGSTGGGSGAMGIQYLQGLTIGHTLTVSVGAAGAANAAGGNTTISSGSQTISTISFGGGNPNGNGGLVIAAPYSGYTSAGDPGLPLGTATTLFASGGKAGILGPAGNGGATSSGPGSAGTAGAVLIEWST